MLMRLIISHTNMFVKPSSILKKKSQNKLSLMLVILFYLNVVPENKVVFFSKIKFIPLTLKPFFVLMTFFFQPNAI